MGKAADCSIQNASRQRAIQALHAEFCLTRRSIRLRVGSFSSVLHSPTHNKICAERRRTDRDASRWQHVRAEAIGAKVRTGSKSLVAAAIGGDPSPSRT